MKKILFALVTAFTAFPLMGNNVNWSSPPYLLSSASYNASDPWLATDPNGNLVAVWVEHDLVKSNTKHLNMNWGTLETLSNTGGSSPRVVADSHGNATAVWLENGVVKSATKSLSGNWTNFTALSSTHALSPELAVDADGDTIAVWTRGGNVEVSTKVFGQSWNPPFIISSTNASSPRIAIGSAGLNTTAYIIWHGTANMSSGTNIVYVSEKEPITGSWTIKKAISDTSHNAAYADVAVDQNGNAVAVWYKYDVLGSVYSNLSVQSAFKLAAGEWDVPVALSAIGMRDPAGLKARVSFDGNGNAVALWNISFDDQTFNIESAIKLIRQNWSSPTDLVSFNPYAYNASMAISSFGDALATYMFYNGDSILIQSSESNTTGFMENIWSIPMTFSSGHDNASPNIAATLTGNAIHAGAMWIHYNGVKNQLLAITGTRSLIEPPSNLLVTQQTQNFGVFSEDYNIFSWEASTSPNVVGYLVYRNGTLIEQVASNVLQIVDRNRTQNRFVTYSVAALDNQQSQSKLVSINFP